RRAYLPLDLGVGARARSHEVARDREPTAPRARLHCAPHLRVYPSSLPPGLPPGLPPVLCPVRGHRRHVLPPAPSRRQSPGSCGAGGLPPLHISLSRTTCPRGTGALSPLRLAAVLRAARA